MSAIRPPKNRKLIRMFGLMASASIMSLMMAGEAQAACTASGGQPLNNITADGSFVDCNGPNTGQTITVNAVAIQAEVRGTGDTLDNSTVTFNGEGNNFRVLDGGSTTNTSVIGNGPGNYVTIGALGSGSGTANNFSLTLNGDGGGLDLGAGSTVTAAPGNLQFANTTAGAFQSVLVRGTLAATGNNGGAFLITGGAGDQDLNISGTLTVQPNGLAYFGGADDDYVTIGTAAVINGGTGGNILFDGGTGNDSFTIHGGGSRAFNTANFEELIVSPGNGVTMQLGGSGNYSSVRIGPSTVEVVADAALGQSNSDIDIVGNARLRLAPTSAFTFNHTLYGGPFTTAVLEQTGQTITYAGGTSPSGDWRGNFLISGGTAIIANANQFGIGTITNNAALQFNNIGIYNNISGTGTVTKTGNGVGALGGTNTYSGGTFVNGGVLQVAAGNSLGSGAVTIAANAILSLNFGTDQTVANNITGSGALYNAAPGTATLTGANTYSGGTFITQGAIRVDDFARLGTGPVDAWGGANLILNYNGAGQLLQTTPFMTGAGGFIKEGTGDVVMSQTSTFTGGTIIRAGRIGLNNGDALGSGDIQIDSGAELGVGGIVLNNNLTGSGLVRKTASNVVELYGDNSGFTGTIQVADGVLYATNGHALGSGILQIDSGTNVQLGAASDSTVVANLSGSGNFEKLGGGLVALTGDGSLFTGGIAVTGGVLEIAGGQNIGTVSGVFIGSAGTLQLNTSGTTQLVNDLFGDGNVIKTGTGTVFLTGTNSYTGGTAIQQGAIRVTDVSFLGTGAIAVHQGAALDLSIAGAQSLNQSISGAGILRKSDLGDLTLLGNSLTGGVDIVGGRVIVSTAAALGSGPVTTAADTQLVFDNASAEGISNLISGAGTLTKNGTGLLAVGNANSYTGGTLVNAGRLVVNASGALGTGTVLVLQNAEIGLGGATLANAISGAGKVIKTANNTGSLTGNNAYSGGTDIQQGTLLVNSPAALGSGGVAIGSGAFLDIDYSGSSNAVLNNVVSGAGSLIKDGAGTVVINASNTFSGGTAINGGRLGLNFGDGLGTGGVTINSGAELGIGNVAVANTLTGTGRVVKTASGTGTLSGNNTYSGGTDIQGGNLNVANTAALGSGTVSIAAGSSLSVGIATNQTLANSLTGAGSLVKSVAGDLTVTNNALTGGMTILGGRVLVNSNAPGLGTGAVAIAGNAELVYTASSNTTFANGLSGAGVFGSGTFRKLGTGQLLFSNPFAIGTLAVDAGSVRLNANLTGNANVAASGRLDGTGRVIGNLTNNGTVAPGNSIGTLNVQGNYVHNAGSVLEIEFDGNGAIDLLAVTGTATLNGGTLRFISTTGAEGSGGTFLTAGGGVTGTFATVETVGAALPLAVIYQPNSAIMAPSVLTARPSTFNAQSLAAADNALGFIDSIGVADLRHGQGNRMWMTGFGSWGDRSASGSTLAYEHNTRGLSGGVNFAAGDAVTLGAAFGWAKGDITLGSNGGGGDQSSLLGAIHARYSGTGFTLGGGAVFGKVDQETLRNVSFNGFSASVNGETDSKIFGAFAEIGLPLGSTGGWAFSANARGSYLRQTQDAYTESGNSPLRLAVGKLKTSTLEGQAKLTAKTSLWDRANGGEETPEGLDLRIDLGGRYLDTLGDRLIPVTFAASNAGVVMQGDTRNSLQGTTGIGLDYTTRGGATFSLGYLGEFGRTDRHSVRAGVSFAF